MQENYSRYHTDPETGVIIPQHLRERVVEYAADHTIEQVQKPKLYFLLTAVVIVISVVVVAIYFIRRT